MNLEDHQHCQDCFRLNCNAPGVCKMARCEFGCGVRLHECKMIDHGYVCSKCKVPCSNAAYGCPAVLQRENVNSHLVVCPASAIFCTMEWNRYPVYSKSRLNWVPFFQPNPVLVKGQLDVELALRDQRVLGDVFKKRCRKGKAKVDVLRLNNARRSSTSSSPHESVAERPQKHMGLNKMALALSALENKLRPKKSGNKDSTTGTNSGHDSGIFAFKTKEGDRTVHVVKRQFQRGVELESEILMPHDLKCCEDVRVGLPSAVDKANIDLHLPQLKVERKSLKAVMPNDPCDDPNDPCEINENDPNGIYGFQNSNFNTCSSNCNEKILTCIDETEAQVDFLSHPTPSEYNDYGPLSNGSKSIPSPPEFVPIHLAEPLGLNVMIETLPKFQKQSPLYSIPCNQVFRRDEFGAHFQNVHSDIHGGLNGWLEQRCPLAQYGCTFVRYRLYPDSQCGRVVFSQELGNFGIRTCTRDECNNGTNIVQCSHQVAIKTDGNLLCSLPIEIIEAIAGMLDGFSLCNFSRTCKLLREVSRRILEKKGIVLFEWEKRIYDNGTWTWQVRQKKWFFSTSFTPVKKWVHSDSPCMAAHLEECRFFTRRIPQKQFRYHSTLLPPGMECLKDTSLDDYEKLLAASGASRVNFNLEERIQELEDYVLGINKNAHSQHGNDYSLEFVIQCDESPEFDTEEAPKISVKYSPNGSLNGNAVETSSQGASAMPPCTNIDREFDPSQSAAAIASAYLYMYSGSAREQNVCPDIDDDVAEQSCRAGAVQDNSCPSRMLGTPDPAFQHNPIPFLDDDMQYTSGIPKSFSAQKIAVQLEAVPNHEIDAQKTAAEIASAYMYMYSGSLDASDIAIPNAGEKENADSSATQRSKGENATVASTEEKACGDDENACNPNATERNKPLLNEEGDPALFSCGAAADPLPDETSSSASVSITPGVEGPLFVSVEDVEHDVGCSLGTDGRAVVAYEIHVKVEDD